MLETQVQSLGQGDSLEKNWQPTPVFLPRKIPWMEGPWDHKESDMTERLHFHFHFQAPLPQFTN